MIVCAPSNKCAGRHRTGAVVRQVDILAQGSCVVDVRVGQVRQQAWHLQRHKDEGASFKGDPFCSETR